MRNYLVLGQYNCICDRCGFEFKSGQLRKEWTGLMVCDGCWEPRHPQDLIRVPKEEIAPPWTRPEPAEVFVDIPEVITTESLIPLLLDQNPDMQLFTEG
jgi:hypothetical protein